MSPENVPYTSGVLLWTQRSIRDRLALVVWPKEGSPTLIVATQEEGYCREKGWIEDIRGYVQHVNSPIDVLAEVLQEKGLSAGRHRFRAELPQRRLPRRAGRRSARGAISRHARSSWSGCAW